MSQGKDIRTQQQYWLGCLDTDICVDTHCHCLPGLDDGPPTMEAALALCRGLAGQGFTHIVATPHQLGYFEAQTPVARIRERLSELNHSLIQDGIPLTVLPGAEIRIDERIPDLLANGEVLALAHAQKYVLLEWPFETFFFPGGLFSVLHGAGYRPVIAHPERNQVLATDPSVVLSWQEYEPVFQITAASLTGRFGRACARAAWAFLDLPINCLVATDAHDTLQRAPGFIDAFGMIVRELGVFKAQELCIRNPLAIVGDIASNFCDINDEERKIGHAG